MAKNARNSRIEFTDLISLSGNLARYSPTARDSRTATRTGKTGRTVRQSRIKGRLLAVAYTNKIIIRASDSLAVSERNIELF